MGEGVNFAQRIQIKVHVLSTEREALEGTISYHRLCSRPAIVLAAVAGFQTAALQPGSAVLKATCSLECDEGGCQLGYQLCPVFILAAQGVQLGLVAAQVCFLLTGRSMFSMVSP